jgi:hypothetical protein
MGGEVLEGLSPIPNGFGREKSLLVAGEAALVPAFIAAGGRKRESIWTTLSGKPGLSMGGA